MVESQAEPSWDAPCPKSYRHRLLLPRDHAMPAIHHYRSGKLGDGQQDRGVLQRLETVAGVRHDQQVSRTGLPGQLTGDHTDPTAEYLYRSLAGFSCSARRAPRVIPMSLCRNTLSSPP